MKKNILIINIILITLGILILPVKNYSNEIQIIPNNEALQILQQAELKRAPWNLMEFTAELYTDSNETTIKNSYQVFIKDKEKTLVIFKLPRFEKGNVLLMVGDNLWYYVKDTRRPTRITPIQRLSGAVSYGDLARMNWTQDYTISAAKKSSYLDKHCYVLSLKAKSNGATYQSIELTTDLNAQPIKAEVFLLSGKHFKTLKFLTYESIQNTIMNTKVEFIDRLNNNRISTLKFSNIKSRDNIPNRFFLKTALSDLSNELNK